MTGRVLVQPTPKQDAALTFAHRVLASDLIGAFNACAVLCGLGPRAGAASCVTSSASGPLGSKAPGTSAAAVKIRLTRHIAFGVQALDLVAHAGPAARVAGGAVRVRQIGLVPLGPPASPRRHGPARLGVGRGDLNVFFDRYDGGDLADFDDVSPCAIVSLQNKSIHTQLANLSHNWGIRPGHRWQVHRCYSTCVSAAPATYTGTSLRRYLQNHHSLGVRASRSECSRAVELLENTVVVVAGVRVGEHDAFHGNHGGGVACGGIIVVDKRLQRGVARRIGDLVLPALQLDRVAASLNLGTGGSGHRDVEGKQRSCRQEESEACREHVGSLDVEARPAVRCGDRRFEEYRSERAGAVEHFPPRNMPLYMYIC